MFFDRPDSGEISILVHLTIDSESEREDPAEFEELAISAGAQPVDFIIGSRKAPSPNLFIGSGKLEEVQAAVLAHKAGLVLFNHTLSPSQERNLEAELKCRVLDRTGLILDIFAQRARSHECKLQVELAQLQHLSTRLKRGWTHLDRQKGGIGMRGAGEKQLELDQRMIGQRIKAINKGLKKVRGQRDQGRRSRRRSEVATISLVGYTNAGKSSLFNTMTDAQTYAADQLFATLDSTLRRVTLKNYGPVIVADTVGFISHLPHQLVEAFHATLEETVQADLLIHVVDAANEFHPDHIFEVDKVLVEIGAKSLPQLQVFNKIDLLPDVEPHIHRNVKGRIIKVWVSAKTGAGMNLLQGAMSELLAGDMAVETLRVAPGKTKLRSQLYDSGFIEEEDIDEEGFYELRVKLPRTNLDRILKQSGIEVISHIIAAQEQTNLVVKDKAIIA